MPLPPIARVPVNLTACPEEQGSPTDGMTTGEAVHTLTPAIFEIVRGVLGWSEQQLLAWNHDGAGALGMIGQTWRCGNLAHGNTGLECIPDTELDQLKVAPKRPRTLDLGCCYLRGRPPFPRLQATVPDSTGAPFVNPNTAINPTTLIAPTEAEVDPFDAMAVLLPEWFAQVSKPLPANPTGATVAFDVGNTSVVTAEGDLPSAFWHASAFESWVRAAVATVKAYAWIAFDSEPAHAECGYSSIADIRDKLDKQTIEVKLAPTSGWGVYNCGDRYYNLYISDEGVPTAYDVEHGRVSAENVWCELDTQALLGCHNPCNLTPPAGTNYAGSFGEAVWPGAVIRFCRSHLEQVVYADFYMWWAQRLLWWGEYCQSPWYCFMAVLSARSALAEVNRLAATLVHELCHANGRNGHCKNPITGGKLRCGLDWWEGEFTNRLMARLGAPEARSKQLGSDRYASILFETAERYGAGDCEELSVEGEHCNVLGRRHRVTMDIFVPGDCVPGRVAFTDTFVLNNFQANLCG